MKRILIVSHTYQAARRRFHDMVLHNRDTVSRYSLPQLTIELGDTQYQFMSAASLDGIQGQTYQSIVMDEMVELTADQTAMIMSRKR